MIDVEERLMIATTTIREMKEGMSEHFITAAAAP